MFPCSHGSGMPADPGKKKPAARSCKALLKPEAMKNVNTIFFKTYHTIITDHLIATNHTTYKFKITAYLKAIFIGNCCLAGLLIVQ